MDVGADLESVKEELSRISERLKAPGLETGLEIALVNAQATLRTAQVALDLRLEGRGGLPSSGLFMVTSI